MSRPIKFRAWDREAERFRYWEYGDTKPYVHPTIEPPQQFTGLFDKNGKEIYEGDILGNPNTGMGKERFPFYKTGWVIFENGAFTLHAFGDDQKDERFEFRKNLEVIGNIYEDPNLLGS